jgi:copper chaperone
MPQAHQPSIDAAAHPGVQVKVDDMTCGHCAGTIKRAIEDAIPGAEVVADPAARLVSVVGADYPTISGIIAQAGYTPAPPGA